MQKNLILFFLFAVFSAHSFGHDILLQKDAMKLNLPDSIQFVHPDGERGWYNNGLDRLNDGTFDLQNCFGLRFQLRKSDDRPLTIRCTLHRNAMKDDTSLLTQTTAVVTIDGKGWQTVTIPMDLFDYNKGQDIFLRYIKSIVLAFDAYESGKGSIAVKDVEVRYSNHISVTSDRYSRPLDQSLKANYALQVKNTSSSRQSYAVRFVRQGWEEMKVSVSASDFSLLPQEEKTVNVTVEGSDYMLGGMMEKQTVRFVPLLYDEPAQDVVLTTVVPVASPFLIHDEAGWQEVKRNTEQYEWAKKELDDFVKTAEGFKVPEIKRGTMSDQGTEGLIPAYIDANVFRTAVAWKLTGKIEYGEKVAETLRRIADPELGYPRTNHLTLQGIPQEGAFEGLIRSYDLLKGSDLLSKTDAENIENTFRLYCTNTIRTLLRDGGISNWTVFNIVPAAEAALIIHDLHLFNTLMYAPCGIIDQFRYGTMDDGWWYEVSLAYNLATARCYTNLVLAAKGFGLDLANATFPAATTRRVGLRRFESMNHLGMSFVKYGPLTRNNMKFKDMWDGIIYYPDYRGVMFGMGDGHEDMVSSGDFFEEAYLAFRDPRYASIIKTSPKRSLVFGVAELPDDTPVLYTQSVHSDNAGIALLRTQNPDRPQRERIQVAMKYGTHGSYHGHFDKVSFLSLMRYGRSFWNPESSWYGYGSYMYKWWVQTSMASNMVVVDGKMQEPADSRCILFHSGRMMQACAAEITCRWSNPPYFGGYDQLDDVKAGKKPYVPIPDDHPAVGELTAYTEPVTQRRLTILTDDYVIVTDYLQGEHEHTFDNLFHLRGVQTPDDVKPAGTDPAFDPNPLSSGQFITDVSNYEVTNGTKVPTLLEAKGGVDWNTGGFNGYQDPGNLHIDLYYSWPRKGTLRIGNYPIPQEPRERMKGSSQVRKTLSYRVKGTQARYVSVLEPYEETSVVNKVCAESADSIVVTLVDGRTHRFTIAGLDAADGDVVVRMTEEDKTGRTITESTEQ